MSVNTYANFEAIEAHKVLIQFVVTQSTVVPVTGLNLVVSAGVYVNAKTSDDDVHMTITGYYITELP